MLIGTTYTDTKVYRGIKHYDSLPLMSADLHEYRDTESKKKEYLMNNLLGCGILSDIDAQISSDGIKLNEPLAVMIDGDISLIQSDDDSPLFAHTDADVTKGNVLGILGWYQHLNSTSVMKKYGGVRNSTIPNELLDNKFHIQVSTRYQFRWYPVLLNMSSSTLSTTIDVYDANGNFLKNNEILVPFEEYEGIYRVKKSDLVAHKDDYDIATMVDYVVSDLYLIPLMDCAISHTNVITGITPYKSIIAKSKSNFISSEEEPQAPIVIGTIWYNHITREFKIYASEEDGFVSSAATMGLLQYQFVHTFESTQSELADIAIAIDVPGFNSNDILRASYDGLELILGVNYTINYNTNKLILREFNPREGDTLHVSVTRIVEANDITNVTAIFNTHMVTQATSTVTGHVKLSDSLSEQGVSSNIAATPKLVYDAVSSVLSDVTSVAQDLAEHEQSVNASIQSIESKATIQESAIDKIGMTVALGKTTISASDYVSDSTYDEYPYRAQITNAAITTEMIPIVTYSVSDAISGIHCPVATTETGKVYVYAAEQPTSSVVIESILLKEGDVI